MDVATRGVFRLAKVSAQAITLGASVYSDSAASLATTVISGNALLGLAVEAAVKPSAIVEVRLNG